MLPEYEIVGTALDGSLREFSRLQRLSGKLLLRNEQPRVESKKGLLLHSNTPLLGVIVVEAVG